MQYVDPVKLARILTSLFNPAANILDRLPPPLLSFRLKVTSSMQGVQVGRSAVQQ